MRIRRPGVPNRTQGNRRALSVFERLESRRLLAAHLDDVFIGPVQRFESAPDLPAMVGISVIDASVVEGNAGPTT